MASDHITVCICTYKRPQMLQQLLMELNKVKTENMFSVSLRVVDNDSERSAYPIVQSSKKRLKFPVKYLVEPQRSVTLARNKGVTGADSMIAFIDDDEFPEPYWLVNLYKTLKKNNVAGVLGPVIPHFDNKPASWLIKSKLCDRGTYPTGHLLHWSKTRTGNVLLSKELMKDSDAKFKPLFRNGGCDVDFFKRLTRKGYQFAWCHEAAVYERVPLQRQTKGYFCRRGFLQGSISLNYAYNSPKIRERVYLLLKTISAMVLYSLALPFLRIAGEHIFMRYLVKDCHHIGRLLAMAGISVIKNREI